MKFNSKEEQILFMVAAILGLHDFFTLPFNSFVITLIFAVVLFYISESLFMLALVLLVPQVIHTFNKIMGIEEKMTNPNEISQRIETMKKASPESFTDLNEISQRVESMKKVDQPKAEVSGVVDESLPSGAYPLEVTLSYPKINEETIGTSVDTHTNTDTVPEYSVPVVGTINSLPKQNPYVPKFDEIGLSTALAQSSGNTTLNASNIKAV